MPKKAEEKFAITKDIDSLLSERAIFTASPSLY
jgi:hypothetical protein